MKTKVKQLTPNFETLQRAFDNKDVALLECKENSTGETVALICAVSFDGKEYIFTPIAKMIDGNPYELFTPPI